MFGRNPLYARGMGAAGRGASEPPPSEMDVLLQSDWRLAAGDGTWEDLLDGDKWDSVSGNAEDIGLVIDAPVGEHFPTHKVVRVLDPDGVRSCWLEIRTHSLGELQVDVPRNYRIYMSNHERDDSDDEGQHPLQDGNPSTSFAVSQQNWSVSTTCYASGDTPGVNNLVAGEFGIQLSVQTSDYYTVGSAELTYIQLEKEIAYRVEVQIVRVSSTQFRMHFWLHDWEDNLIADDSDVTLHGIGGTLADDPLWDFNIVAHTAWWCIGCNGAAGPWPYHYGNQTGVAIVEGLAEGEQIGPYGNVDGEVLP